MEIFLIVCLLVILVVRWVYLKNRLETLEERLEILANLLAGQDTAITRLQQLISAQKEKETAPPPEPVEPAPSSEIPTFAVPPPFTAPAEAVVERPAPAFAAAAPPPRTTDEWEARLGGNWLNKLGVFILVVGIALALGYSFTRVGPVGRVATSLAVSFALLVSGAVWERGERYRLFARGLMGGGWAALYITVYAMHAVDAARIIENAAAGFFLLLAVSAGMIAHSLKYRSQTVTGVAYFAAFGTLAITEVSGLPLLALIPLAISLLIVAHRFSWTRIVLLGVAATYGITVLRGQSGAPLWQAESIFAVYWLMFEVFDVLHPEAWLLPLNAAGFLGLSLMKWHSSSPDSVWMLLAATAAAYLVSAGARIRSGRWHGAATLGAALAAAAVFQRLDHQWIASALVVEAEVFYLAGVRLRSRYLRWLGSGLFAIEIARLLVSDMTTLPLGAWVPVASLDAVVFYANRAMVAADTFYGFAGAGMLALIVGYEFAERYRAIGWFALAGGSFGLGWRRRLADFRQQGYLLGILGLAAALIEAYEPPLVMTVAMSYAGALCALMTGPGRFLEQEARLLRIGGAVAASIAAGTLVWRMLPGEYLGLGWMVLAILLLELGLRGLPKDLCRLAIAVAAFGMLRLAFFNLPDLPNSGPWAPRLIPLGGAIAAYAIGARGRKELGGLVMVIGFVGGAIFFLYASWALLPADAVAPIWAAAALVMFLAAREWTVRILLLESYVAAAAAFGRWWLLAFLPSASPSTASAVWGGALTATCFYAAMLAAKRGERERTYFSLLGTALTSLLLYHHISGSMLTVVWGVQGVALLAAGFPLRDRLLRLSGLALLLLCIGKLFAWDLRHLETLPRIFSFIVLGLLLLGVSWVYTRYRERVSRYL